MARPVERALTSLVAAITDGTYPVGQRLPSESKLSESLGVSRPCLREAMHTLRQRGLIETRNGVGSFVRRQHSISLEFGGYLAADLAMVRHHLEVPAARRAAETATPQVVSDLVQLQALLNAETNVDSWVDLDTRFHVQLADASGNRLLSALVAQLRGALALQSTFLNQVDARRMVASNVEHQAIVEAVASGDPDAAAQAVELHLAHVETSLAQAMAAQSDESVD